MVARLTTRRQKIWAVVGVVAVVLVFWTIFAYTGDGSSQRPHTEYLNGASR